MIILQITQPHSTEISNWVIRDTSTIEKDIHAVIADTKGTASS